ncbi:MAG: alpha/beta hydrolase [SAR202 cluster bacterium]|nr:alpha/beta hydrolase [SAR202 cluster bacterium]
MGKIIIGIHGRSNKPRKELLGPWWEQAIREGLAKNQGLPPTVKFEFHLAYYSDLFFPQPAPDDNEPYVEALPGALKRYETSLWDRIRAYGQNWLDDPLDWLEERSGKLSRFARKILQERMQDLSRYYQEPDLRTNAQARLRSLIQNLQGNDIMLIAHSMGSIVAYEALRDMGQEPGGQRGIVPQLVTLGSPLGLTPVKGEVMARYSGRLRTPSVVTQSWVNFSDADDHICIDAHLADDYDQNSAGIKVRDQMVSNDFPDNPHKIYGYLRTPEVSEHIARFL